MSVFVPYCGLPPVPGSESWNFAPTLIGGLAAAGALLLVHAARNPKATRFERLSLAAGWLTLALAFVTPLCNLSVALFSARATQHIVLTLIAAPLIAQGLIERETRFVAWASSGSIFVAAAAFAAVFWFWHSPLAYDETLRDNAVYWLMHVSILGAALALWIAILRVGGLAAFVVVSLTGVQMSLLGAVLTFARAPLYAVHEFTTAPWGLTWLQDQELGGLIMWVPAGLLLTLYSSVALGVWLGRMDAADRVRLKSA